MKTTELIKILKNLIKEHGDMDVFVQHWDADDQRTYWNETVKPVVGEVRIEQTKKTGFIL